MFGPSTLQSAQWTLRLPRERYATSSGHVEGQRGTRQIPLCRAQEGEEQSPSSTRRRFLWNAAAVGAAAMPCGCPRPSFAGEGWTYSDTDTFSKWGGMCRYGARQSPIDFPISGASSTPERIDIACDYSRSASVNVIDTGHGNIQVNVPAGSTITLHGRKLQLVQWHFHTPSEHAFGGKRQAMEVHLVHKDTVTGELAVVGVLLRRGGNKNLEALQMALENAPNSPKNPKVVQQADLSAALGELLAGLHCNGRFEHYVGSLTTPPCTEGVQWYVAMVPANVTDSQILDFEDIITSRQSLGTNSRPIQAIKPGCIDIDLLTI